MANLPWLPDPKDYAHPTNGPLPHPSKASAPVDEASSAPGGAEPDGSAAPPVEPATTPSIAEAQAEVAQATADLEAAQTVAATPTVGPFPPAPPTIAGDQLTESVNQAGPVA